MISSVKQPTVPITGSNVFRQKLTAPLRQFSVLPPLPALKTRGKSSAIAIAIAKPLCVSAVEGFGELNKKRSLIACKAYEADRSEPIEEGAKQEPSEAAKKLKIGVYFATWWALNVVFNIYNKKVLNAFPFPWLTSTLSLACGSLMMLISWATRLAEAPKTDFEFWKALLPVS